ncbi:phage head-tail connector protein [Cellulosilyticum sp. ST5]|uniref:phage head-tail connector protein n=1 Tax=Cellulosilyticum sp. ST5 TaxID=3055805 RepID=UPI003977B2EF
MSQIERLKLRLGIADTAQDELLQAILEDVEGEILASTNRKELTAAMHPLQIKIAIIQYNKQGSEGMSSDSQGGKSQSWVDGFPKDIQDALVGFRRLRVSNYASKKS